MPISDAALPEGVYLGEIEDIGPPMESLSGNRYRVASVRWIWWDLSATSRSWHWTFIDHPQGAWVWNTIVEDFDRLPELINRVFLFKVGHLVLDPMCELLP